MAEFTLDTSGEVRGSRLFEQPDGNWRSHWQWSDLDPFTQGYVEALFAGMQQWHPDGDPVLPVPAPEGSSPHGVARVGFSDLAPETLAAILKDCEEFLSLAAHAHLRNFGPSGGRSFWEHRQAGKSKPHVPPLTPYLGDDGRVYLREGA